MPKAILSLEGFIRKISKLSAENRGVQLYFRGHSSVSYKIEPSVERSSNLRDSEHLMIRQLIAQHPKDFSDDLSLFDQLVRAQHYGLPTRLLDISSNPLVALYFAVCSNMAKRASVIVVKPVIGGQKYFDSDSVACLSSLSLLTKGEKDKIAVEIRKKRSKIDPSTRRIPEADLQEFNAVPEVQKLVQLVREGKSDFRPIVQPYDLLNPVLVTPKKLHSRIVAQSGAFILFGLGRKSDGKNLPAISFEEIHIEQDRKTAIQAELAQVGITESTLFPEIEKAASAIKRRYE